MQVWDSTSNLIITPIWDSHDHSMGVHIHVRLRRIQIYLGFISDSLKFSLVQNSFVFTSKKYYTKISFMNELRLMCKEILVAYFETLPDRTVANHNTWYDHILSRLNKILHNNSTDHLISVVYWDIVTYSEPIDRATFRSISWSEFLESQQVYPAVLFKSWLCLSISFR
jgi:hypothetical protein